MNEPVVSAATLSESKDTQPNGAPVDLAPWLRWVGHGGYVAEGIVYVLIGTLALVAALEPSQPNGARGAFAKLAAAPFGHAMLALLALGLAAFVLWQAVLGILDPEHRRNRRTFKRRAVRVGCLLNGALHAVLVAEAAWLLLGFGAGPDGGRSQAVWTGRAMALPLGRWVIAASGVGIGSLAYFSYTAPSRAARLNGLTRRIRNCVASSSYSAQSVFWPAASYSD